MITVDFGKLPISPEYRILDIGCGTGRHMGEAVRYAGVRAVGIDRNLRDLAAARERMIQLENFGECRGCWTLGKSDITRLPFHDGSFDLVICSEVLEHIPDQEDAVFELVRVLKPGGNLVVSVPRYLPERICWSLSPEYRNTEGGHIRIYRRKELKALLEGAGVRQWHIHWAHGLHTPFWWLKCLIGPERTDALPVRWYHRFLVWDMMRRPRPVRSIEKLLNPLLGKSLVLYLAKPSTHRRFI